MPETNIHAGSRGTGGNIRSLSTSDLRGVARRRSHLFESPFCAPSQSKRASLLCWLLHPMFVVLEGFSPRFDGIKQA